MRVKLLIITAAVLFMRESFFSQTIPQYTVTYGDSSLSAGYYFIDAFTLNAPAAPDPQMIFDRLGRLVYFRYLSYTASDFKIQPNGKITYAFSPGVPIQAKFHIMDSTFTIRDSVRCLGGILTDNHDCQILPNGHYLLMGYETRVMDLSSYHWFNGNGSPGSVTASVKCGVIQELDENKNLVFSWKAADHFSFGDVEEEWLFSPNNVDWTHFNSVAEDADGNIFLSMRHFSEVTKINRQTGAIMWRFGGKQNQFTFISDPYNGFHGQHDARRIAGGHITLFDNGKAGTVFHPARGVEYSIDEVNHSAALVWSKSYSANSMSEFMGNAQRLSQGTTVIGWGNLLNANITFGCYKPDGGEVMSISFPDSSITYRAFNFMPPWFFHRPLITCSSSGGSGVLSAPAGYSSYKWSTGETTQSISITKAGEYYVFVPYGQGGYISSKTLIVNDPGNVCQALTSTGNENTIPLVFSLEQNYPNPFNPTTKIRFEVPIVGNGRDRSLHLTIYDALGKEIGMLVNEPLLPGKYEVTWNASEFSSGIYFYSLTAGDYKEVKRMVLLK